MRYQGSRRVDLSVLRRQELEDLNKYFGSSSFSNCFSHATADTADDWLKSFAFAWNQLI